MATSRRSTAEIARNDQAFLADPQLKQRRMIRSMRATPQ
jgi:hypothetical protein